MDALFVLIIGVVAILWVAGTEWLSVSQSKGISQELAGLYAQLQDWVQSPAARQLAIDPEHYEAVPAWPGRVHGDGSDIRRLVVVRTRVECVQSKPR